MTTDLLWVISQDMRELLKNQSALQRDIRGLRKEIRALKPTKHGINWTLVFDHWLTKLAVISMLLAANWELKDILSLLSK
jgi:hypothetical protein